MGELECGSCGERIEGERHQIIHHGNMFDEVLDVCEKCKVEDLQREIQELSLCSFCQNDDCPSILEKTFEGTKQTILVTECDFFVEP